MGVRTPDLVIANDTLCFAMFSDKVVEFPRFTLDLQEAKNKQVHPFCPPAISDFIQSTNALRASG
jgi:hypothetical protein